MGRRGYETLAPRLQRSGATTPEELLRGYRATTSFTSADAGLDSASVGRGALMAKAKPKGSDATRGKRRVVATSAVRSPDGRPGPVGPSART